MTRRTLAAILLGFPFVSGLVLGQGQDPLAGRSTPDLELLTVDGEIFTLDMGARDTVLYVIAPGNPACEQNLENMKALWRAKRGEFRFVAVSVKEEGLKEDAATQQLPFPVYAFRDHRDPAIGSYGFGAFPAVYVTSARTRTIQRVWGGVFRNGKLKDAETFFGVRLPGPKR